MKTILEAFKATLAIAIIILSIWAIFYHSLTEPGFYGAVILLVVVAIQAIEEYIKEKEAKNSKIK